MSDFYSLPVTTRGNIEIPPDCPIPDKLKVLCGYVEKGCAAVADYFKHPFINPFDLKIFPDKDSLVSYWQSEWEDMIEPACWMISSGTEKALAILSPEDWESEACEQDFADESRTKRIIKHELVHVFHDQYNQQHQFAGMEPLTWFVEGVAVHFSGQEDDAHRFSAYEAVKSGSIPESLDRAWTGRYRYSICGSLVRYMESILGREMIFRLLWCADEQTLFKMIGMSPQALLEQWQSFVVHNKQAFRNR